MSNSPSFAYTGHENLLVMQHAVNYNSFLRGLLRRYGAGSEGVVDFGAGVGAMAEDTRLWAQGLVCVEPDPVQADILRSSGFDVCTDINKLCDESVGYVYSVNVFEHIADDEAVMASIHAKLRSGGKLLVYVPALQWLFSSMDTAVGHVRRYHSKDLEDKLVKVGFLVRRSEYVDCLGVPATLAYKLAGGSDGSINTGALKLYDRFFFPVSRLLDRLFNGWLGKNLLVVCEKK